MFFRKKSSNKKSEPSTAPRATGTNALSRRFKTEDERPTTLLEDVRPSREPKLQKAPAESETRILSEVHAHPLNSDDPMQDPPVGWLVIVEGPGKGRAVAIGYGMNAMGRSTGQRVRLDFGDERISRENHAMVIYDGKSGRYFVQHGGGPNLTYLGKEPVLTPVPIKMGDQISLGNTILRFVPLCGDEFDWLRS